MRIRRLLSLVLLVPSILRAQDSASANATADHATIVTFGLTSGSMSFTDQRVQEGLTGVLRYHFNKSISISASPTYARVAFPASLGGGAVSGLTDLPIELDADHTFDWGWSPTIGLALGSTIPVGDQATGFGSGSLGTNIGGGVGVSPTDAVSLHLGLGKPLTDYSATSALGSSGSTWSDAEIGYQLSSRVNATVGFDGDLASHDSLGAARAIALSLATTIVGPYTLTVSGGHGVSGAAARWTLALGIGTDYAGLEALGSSSAIQRFFRAMGGSSSSHRPTSTPGSGHGKAP
jgi:hypothetical protein